MRLKFDKILLLATFIGFANLTSAAIKLPSFFADHMVLQQKSQVKIWGTATGKKDVTVKTSWNKKTYHCKLDESGNWQVVVATPNAGGPFELELSQENKMIIHDVLIGEVWICSGQSNMDMPMEGYKTLPITNSAEILLESNDPELRLFHVQKNYSSVPLTDVKGNWSLANSESVASFSAVGYQFAKYLRKSLGVPVGIIQSTWGGSPIESWMDKSLVTEVLNDHLATNTAIKNTVHQTPGNLFNAMILPLTGYQISGVIWYQGEQNRHNYFDYLSLQHAMVTSWRNKWGIGNWPFYLVQLAPMKYPGTEAFKVPLLREAQLKLPDTLTNSGVAIIVDAGEENNIHPANKTIVSKRLAYLALTKTYRQRGLPGSGPRYKNIAIKADTVYVSFTEIPLGLTTYEKKITQFEVAGKNHVFYPALARLRNDKIEVFSMDVKEPIAVRYAFKDWCFGEIYNVEGLPLSPFRSDNW